MGEMDDKTSIGKSGNFKPGQLLPADTGNGQRQLHLSVLPDEIISYLAPQDGGIYADATLGLGGHTKKILEASDPGGRVIGFEWDAKAMAIARKNLSPYGDRITFIRRNFAEIKQGLAEVGITRVDGLLVDLGISSLQLDGSGTSADGRGFSFKGGEPLDMRMDDRNRQTAADLINTAKAEQLADIFYYYGDEIQSRRVAELIVQERKKGRIESTDQLADIVARAIPRRFHPKKIHVATKVFQALRIAVNKELDNLSIILDDAAAILNPGGRFCVISFHSLEDRLVKSRLKANPLFKVLTKKPVVPGRDECRTNPRARSAKLRVATRLATEEMR